MGTESRFLSERGIRINAAAVLRAARAAPRETWLAELESHLIDDGSRFSFRFLDGTRLFGYPSAERDMMLTALASCIQAPRSAKVGRALFAASDRAEIRLDYVRGTLALFVKSSGKWQEEPFRARNLPPKVAAAIRAEPTSKQRSARTPAPASYAPRRLHEFRSPKGKSVFLSYSGSSVEHALKPQKYAKCVRVWCSGISARWVMKAAADGLLSRGHLYAGARPPFAPAAIDWKAIKRMDCRCAALPHTSRCAAKKYLGS